MAEAPISVIIESTEKTKIPRGRISDQPGIIGTFRVNITTIQECMILMRGFILDYKDNNMIDPEFVSMNTMYGKFPIRPIFTFLYDGTEADLRVLLDKVLYSMSMRNIPYWRVQILSNISNTDIPKIPLVGNTGLNFMEVGHNMGTENYFQFSFRIKIASTKDWDGVVKQLTKYGVHIYFNQSSKKLRPITVLRNYGSLTDVSEQFSIIRHIVSSLDLSIDQIERMYSIFDSNIELDKYWIYSKNPKVIDNMTLPEMSFLQS
jgi:hypothetical protein